MKEREADSDDAFVAHFRNKYDDEMPIWALTEILELGHLGRLYSGLNNSLVTEIATAYGAPALELCRAAGMVSLGQVALDGTKVRANESRRKAMRCARLTEKHRVLAGKLVGVPVGLRAWQVLSNSEQADHRDIAGAAATFPADHALA